MVTGDFSQPRIPLGHILLNPLALNHVATALIQHFLLKLGFFAAALTGSPSFLGPFLSHFYWFLYLYLPPSLQSAKGEANVEL
jgi:hypothetical protein